ncbi:MAG: L-2-hydroxyglutarate oxidase [Acidobacteriota bacterium]|nr:L-2-hydroxyglutarate oxidase [Acidobacteriota bacterium]
MVPGDARVETTFGGPGQPPARVGLAVVGGGIIGLAVARELQLRDPSRTVCVLERETSLATHQTGHNSGVVHSGVYYRPGSLKARLCVAGARALYEHCAEHGIAHRRCGKLIVALGRHELPALAELERRAAANGLSGVRRLTGAEIADVEPHCSGLAALHCPGTGIVDFAALARSLAEDVLVRGGTIATACEVLGIGERQNTVVLEHARGTTEAAHAIVCAGAWADRLARLAGADADPRIVPFRGAYLRVSTQQRELVRALIYPVPNPALPFLGVHLSRALDGSLMIGPSAVPALARDGYRLATVDRRDLGELLGWPGTWRMARRWWRTGLREIHHALAPGALLREAARYVPGLAGADAQPAPSGVRAQAVGRDGALLDDFAFSLTGRTLHLRNAPSPGATASLAIARHVADSAGRAFAR